MTFCCTLMIIKARENNLNAREKKLTLHRIEMQIEIDYRHQMAFNAAMDGAKVRRARLDGILSIMDRWGMPLGNHGLYSLLVLLQLTLYMLPRLCDICRRHYDDGYWKETWK